MFPQGDDNKAFVAWVDQGLTCMCQMFHARTRAVKSFQDLKTEFGIPLGHFLAYLQLRNHCKRYEGPEAEVSMEKTFLDTSPNSSHYSLSAIHLRLQQLYDKPLSSSNVSKWGLDLQVPEVVDRLVKENNKVRKLVGNEMWRETQFKLLH